MVAIQDDLRGWGQDRAINSPPNGYPGVTPFARFIRNPGSANINAIPIDDRLHLAIDAAVSRVRGKNELQGIILCEAYIKNKRDQSISNEMKHDYRNGKSKYRPSRATVRSLRERAEHWIDGYLSE